MLAIEINFLTGRFVATAHHDRSRTEWPPHPARFFSALVATWADADRPDPIERQALEWIETQPPPSIHAPEGVSRKVVSHFVPVNDATVVSRSPYMNRYTKIKSLLQEIEKIDPADPRANRKLHQLNNRVRKQRIVASLVSDAGQAKPGPAMELFPENRIKQERLYPSVTPVEPRVTYLWNCEPPKRIETALDGLLSRVTRFGHSSSLVSCRLGSDPPSPTHIPGDGGTVLRAVRPGQLAALEREHANHQASRPRALPFLPARYRSFHPTQGTTQHLKPDTSGELLIFEFAPRSRKVPSTRAAELAAILRATVFHYAQEPFPEGFSGHGRDGSRSTQPHVGYLALPWVGSRHSDGRLMGMAIGIPQVLDTESRRSLLRAVGTWESNAEKAGEPLTLNFGRAGRLELQRIVGVSELVTLRPWVWDKAARQWVSVTPIALPTHPGPLGRGTAAARSKAWERAERAVFNSCQHVGLPEPSSIALSLDPFISGVRPAHRFPAFRQGSGQGKPVTRRLVHASVTFEQPVEGPLVLGAGRYLGLGLMRPIHEERPPNE